MSNSNGRHSSNSSSSASFRGCCCCLFLLFTFLLLLILAIILIVFLALKPKKSHFDLHQVGVQSLYLSQNTGPTSTTLLSFNIRMVFVAENDNSVGIKYDDSKFTIMYKGIPLGWGAVPGFYQPAHSVRTLQTIIAVDRVSLLQADAADLIRDANLYDRVSLRVVGDVGAKIRIIGFTSPGAEQSTMKKLSEMDRTLRKSRDQVDDDNSGV